MQILVSDETERRKAAKALAHLRSAQAELVQREKLASLGRMVAGIAHELNTPIGNALTVATTFNHQVRQLQKDVDSGQLKRTTLTDFLAAGVNGTDVLESALNKAHAVITNFRQTTKDHTQEPCVEFCVSSLLLSLQISLDIAYKDGPIALQFDLVESVQMESYPGHVRWIIEQLVYNANTHAFSGMEKGAIRVALVDQDDAVVLSVRDNGRGIDPAIQDKVFDPFFSARLGGSVGLGLNMVYSMVTRKLGGRIQLRDAEPHGAHFEIRLPKRVPVDGES